MSRSLNPVSWITWVGAVLVALSATRNPLYLIAVLLWIAIVSATIEDADTPPIPISIIRFGLVVVMLSAVFNALTVHVGSTELFRLPRNWILIGGPITLEALIYGVLNGLVLTGMFAAFTALNKALPVRDIIRLIPRAFHPVAVVISIAVTFVPTLLHQFEQIKDAQRVRGHRVRGLRDWLPLLLPLLVGGLERALKLAEAMVARGFAASGEGTHPATVRLSMIGGLLAVLAGWLLRLLWNQMALGGGLLLLGVLLIIGALWVVGRQTPHTVYRPARWSPVDFAMIYCAVVVVAVFLIPLPGLDRASIFYYPYPRLTVPGFSVPIGLASLGLLGPLLLRLWRKMV